MTCLKDRVLSGVTMKFHTSMLGTFLVSCIHLGTKYADFQEKIFVEISGKKFQTSLIDDWIWCGLALVAFLISQKFIFLTRS